MAVFSGVHRIIIGDNRAKVEKHENAQVDGKPSCWFVSQDEALQVTEDGLFQGCQDCTDQDQFKLVGHDRWNADGSK
jgi:hypothetical protein